MNTIIEHQTEFQELKKLQALEDHHYTENPSAKDEKQLMMPPATDVNVRVAQMYRVLSFCGDEQPIWEEFKDCFTSEAILINNWRYAAIYFCLSFCTFIKATFVAFR